MNLVSVCRDRFAGCEQQPELTCGDQGMCEAIERTKLDVWSGPPPFQPGELDAGPGATDAGSDGSLGAENRVVQLALGDRHSCALWASGAVHCWGADDFRQLSSQVDECPGQDDSYMCPAPRQLRMPDAVSLSAGAAFNCAAFGVPEVKTRVTVWPAPWSNWV